MSRLDSAFDSLIKLEVIIPILAYMDTHPKPKYTMQELWGAVKGSSEPVSEELVLKTAPRKAPETRKVDDKKLKSEVAKDKSNKTSEKSSESIASTASTDKLSADKPGADKPGAEAVGKPSEEPPKKCIHVIKKRGGGQAPCANFALTGSTWCKTHGKGKAPAKESDEDTPAQSKSVRVADIPNTPYSKEAIHGFITRPKTPGNADGPHEAICIEKEGKLRIMDKQDRIRAIGIGLDPVPETSYNVLFEEVCKVLAV